MSGLTLTRATSFSRQLVLLGTFLRKRGIDVTVTGPGPEQYNPSIPGENSTSAQERACEQYDYIRHIAGNKGIDGAILLGYPDQFPFVHKAPSPDFPCFLWAQFSRPPDPAAIGKALAVPLTPRSGYFLEKGGVMHRGPVIPHGVDTGMFYPPGVQERRLERRKRGLQDCLVIGTVGAHSARKRFGDIIQTAARLRSRLPEIRLVIKTDRVVSGDGTDIMSIARKHGLTGQLTVITGNLSDDEMRALYGIMDVYLNLSEWEGFCIPVVEAMACGVPVASLPGQGPGEIVPYTDLRIPVHRTSLEGGSTLTNADPRKAAEILYEMLHHLERLGRLRDIGVEESRTKYDIRTVTSLWIDLISPAQKIPCA